jgi:hypothetical protein
MRVLLYDAGILIIVWKHKVKRGDFLAVVDRKLG